MSVDEIAAVLSRLGCPADKTALLAAQLDKRAAQLAAQKSRSYDEALAHLLKITVESGGFPKD